MNNSKITTTEELVILTDIVTAMAMFALAKSCSEEEINICFESGKVSLTDQGFNSQVINKISDRTKAGVLFIKNKLE